MAECEGDCDDTINTDFPGGVEVCDARDNNCDGSVDEGFDGDGDSYTTCGADGIAATADDDCDDVNPAAYPGAPELCDGLTVDNNCNGTAADEGLDLDGDGENTCTDCSDTDPLRFTGAPERCNGLDDDCDGTLPPDRGRRATATAQPASARATATTPTRDGVPRRARALQRARGRRLRRSAVPASTETTDADGDTFVACAECN